MKHETQNIEHKAQKREQKASLKMFHVPCFLFCGGGFTILYAILVGSLLLTISVAVFSLNLRDLNLSSASRESQTAFAAADSATECAIYWDLQATGFPNNSIFATSTPLPQSPPPFPPDFRCNGTFVIYTGAQVVADSRSAITTFQVTLDSRACAFVTVMKTDPDGDGLSDTKIESRGQNDCQNVNAYNVRRVERAIRVRY